MSSIFGRKIPRKFSLAKKQKIFHSPYFFNDDYNFERLDLFFSLYDFYELEIGFGTGENLMAQAKLKPNTGFIACDPHLRGHIEVLKFIEDSNVKNIILSDLCFQNMKKFLKSKISLVYILFPDPWPKKKHNKRRLINNFFVEELEKIVEPLGNVLISSDNFEYIDQINRSFTGSSFLKIEFKESSNTIFNNLGIVKTKYYLKALSNGCNPKFIHFKKNP